MPRGLWKPCSARADGATRPDARHSGNARLSNGRGCRWNFFTAPDAVGFEIRIAERTVVAGGVPAFAVWEGDFIEGPCFVPALVGAGFERYELQSFGHNLEFSARYGKFRTKSSPEEMRLPSAGKKNGYRSTGIRSYGFSRAAASFSSHSSIPESGMSSGRRTGWQEGYPSVSS